MLLTDYFRSERDLTWDIGVQCGVEHGVIRLPEDRGFDYTDLSHWRSVCDKFTSFGIKPVIVEPMPNELHDHIKTGDERRDEAIEKVIKMLPNMKAVGIEQICFNWMAHIGWLRTSKSFIERGGARVTEFNIADFRDTGASITAEKLWKNYEYFIDAVLPYAEKNEMKLSLHPDDPPLPRLGGVERIMISADNVHRAIFDIHPSECLGLTLCQANFFIMGEDIEEIVRRFREKIFFIHFRNTKGCPTHFRESFHDNGDIDMAKAMRCYVDAGINVPIRVDHVPTMAGEMSEVAGYDALGRLFAIGYLKGILEATGGVKK